MLQRRQTKELLALAEEAETHLWGEGREEWLERLDREHENLVWALRWAIGRDENETALRLSIALYPYWLLRRELEEGQRWLRAALAKADLLPTAMRAKALSAAANLTGELGDNPRSVTLHQQALELWRQLGDRLQETISLDNLAALAKSRDDLERGAHVYEENLALSREIGSRRLTGLR